MLDEKALERKISGEVVAHPVHAAADSAGVHVRRTVCGVGDDCQRVEVDEHAVAGVLEVELLRPDCHLPTYPP